MHPSQSLGSCESVGSAAVLDGLACSVMASSISAPHWTQNDMQDALR